MLRRAKFASPFPGVVTSGLREDFYYDMAFLPADFPPHGDPRVAGLERKAGKNRAPSHGMQATLAREFGKLQVIFLNSTLPFSQAFAAPGTLQRRSSSLAAGATPDYCSVVTSTRRLGARHATNWAREPSGQSFTGSRSLLPSATIFVDGSPSSTRAAFTAFARRSDRRWL